MKKKGFTLIEVLICVAIVGILIALLVPFVLNPKGRGRAENRNGYTMPVQEVKEQVRSNRISISEVGEAGYITYYIVKDLNNGQEYLVGKFSNLDRAGLSIVKMER
jgi:prepilin-type N-terminal cleavage/methylation domain-containing protein